MSDSTFLREDRLVTGEELRRLDGIGRCELVDGRVVAMSPPGAEHGRVEALVLLRLHEAIRACGVQGRLLVGETGVYTRRNPDRVRGMDVAFISTGRLARVSNFTGYLDVAPELIVEIMSPDDSQRGLEEKAAEYHLAGAVLVLIVDPTARRAWLCRADTRAEPLEPADVFEAPDVLPGVRIPVERFFDE